MGCHEMDDDVRDHDTLDCGYSLAKIFDSREKGYPIKLGGEYDGG